jgi:hypothetical protein
LPPDPQKLAAFAEATARDFAGRVGTVDEATQARFTVRGAVEAMAAGAERVRFYTLDDGPNRTAFPPEDAFGLYHHDGSP